jgi:TonB family protein
MNSLLTLVPALLDSVLLLSVQLLLILAIRKPVARWFGAANAYRLWLLPLLWLPFHWMALPAVDWAGLATLVNMEKAGSSGVVGVVSWFPLAMQNAGFELDMPMFDLMNIDAFSTSPLWQASVLLWLGLAAVLGILQAWIMLRFSRELQQVQQTPSTALQEAVQRDLGKGTLPRLACVQGIGTPALFGILRPVLLLPVDFLSRFDAIQRRLILAHELVHYRRRDNIWNLLATMLRILFWFNPLVHIAWRCYRLDQELSCDAIALGNAQGKQGLLYARTLIESAGGALPARHQPTLTAWGQLREIRERTRLIKLHATHSPLQTTGKWLLLLLVVLGCQGTATLSQVLAQEVGAGAEAVAQSNTMRREVLEHIDRVMQMREAEDFAGALALLDELRPRVEAGELIERDAMVVWQIYASVAMGQDDYQGAYEHNLRILALPGLSRQNRAQTLQQLGAIAYQLEQYPLAIENFIAYLEYLDSLPTTMQLDAHKSQVNLRIAYAWWMQGEHAAAIPWIEQAVDGNPQDRNSLVLLRSIYQEIGNTEKAMEIAQLIAEHFDETENEIILEYLPIIVVQPQYPFSAIREKIEGWVQVQFDVNEEGTVVDPKVVDVSPEGVFDQAGLDAIAQFKFNPRMVDGVPQLTKGVQYVFRFNLQDE